MERIRPTCGRTNIYKTFREFPNFLWYVSPNTVKLRTTIMKIIPRNMLIITNRAKPPEADFFLLKRYINGKLAAP